MSDMAYCGKHTVEEFYADSHYCSPCIEDEITTLRARVAELEAALRDTAHGGDSDGPCWCFYVVLMHPPDDPQDGVKVRDGHTEECWRARACLAKGEGDK